MSGYDVVLVGGGSAGAALAARLSEDSSLRVLLLEAGLAWRAAEAPPEIRVPAWGPCFDVARIPEFHWPGLTVRQTAAQPGPVPYMRGRGLGGSSTVNGQIALRPPLDDFDGWASYGAAGWTGAAALRLFRRIEDDVDFGDAPGHGRGGPLAISRAPAEWWSPLDLALRDAAVDLGYPYCADVHAPGAPATATWPMTCTMRNGRRETTNDGYLEAARRRPNLTIVGGAVVEHVLFDPSGRRAVGVRYRSEPGAGAEEVHGGEIVLCAGAVHSPALLQRSGIGPADHLAALGIGVRADLPVGTAVQDHPFIAILLDLDDDPLHQDRPTVKCAVSYSSGLDGGAARDMVIAAGNRVQATPEWGLPSNLMVWQHECHSRGYLRITADDPEAPLDIDLGLLSDSRDLARMRDGLRRAAGLAAHPALAKISRGASIGDAQVRTRTVSTGASVDDLDDAELDRVVLTQAASASHISSSCPIGEVVDPHGRVLGVEGLRVADLSIAPKIPRANTNLTAVLIGERIAELMTGAAPLAR